MNLFPTELRRLKIMHLRVGGMIQVVESLPSKQEVQTSNTRITKNMHLVSKYEIHVKFKKVDTELTMKERKVKARVRVTHKI
jgi:hypothetical protein